MAKTHEFPMISDESTGNNESSQARALVAAAAVGRLATLDFITGFPYASLVSLAATASPEPIFLLSGLARHTQNLAHDPRASLLLEGDVTGPDRLAAARVTVQGRITPTRYASAKPLYLARHPEAADYAEFADFKFYTMHVLEAHLIAGFGRIRTLSRDAFIKTDDERAES